MKAVRFHKTGGPEVLVYEDVPDPTPRDGEVLIKVEAAGLNFSDVMRQRGDNYPEPSPTPFILGVEVAGTVAAASRLPFSSNSRSPWRSCMSHAPGRPPIEKGASTCRYGAVRTSA